MTKAVSDLSSNVGEVVRKEINETVLESVKMLGNTGLDIKRLKTNASESVPSLHVAELEILSKGCVSKKSSLQAVSRKKTAIRLVTIPVFKLFIFFMF